MKLLVLTQHFPPELGAASTRLFELTRRLAARGHELQVITAMPGYPSGRTFDGYRGKLYMQEEIGGMRAIRTWMVPSRSTRMLPRTLSTLTFAVSSLLLGAWRPGRHDVLLFDSPPLMLVPVALALGRLTGARVVMNVADIWPDIALRLGYPVGDFALRIMAFLERLGYEHADVVATSCPTAMDQVSRRFPHVKTTVIGNGADLELFQPAFRSQEARAAIGAGEDDFLAGYFGLHGLFQGLEVIIEAAARLRDHPRIKFVMVGDGPTRDSLMALARRQQLDNLLFRPSVPRTEIPAMLASCDAALIPLATELPGTMPSKIYEALASGVPLVVARGCEGAALVDQYHVGRVFPPLDAEALAARLVALAEQPGELAQIRQNCLALARRLDRDSVVLRTEAILKAVAAGNPLPEVQR